MVDATGHHSDIDTTLALLGDVDGDLEFFHGLFDDLSGSDGLRYDNGPVPPSPSFDGAASTTTRSDRRRQRWSPVEEKTSATLSSVLVTSGDWRQTAKLRKHEREQAEKENAQLRKLVNAHARATQKMTKLLHKATLLSARGPIVLEKPLWTPYMGPPFNLHELTLELDKLARNADAVMASSALVSSHPEPFKVENRIVQTATGDAFETTVQVAWVLPFGVEHITSTLLVHSIRLVTRKNQRSVQTVHEDAQLKVTQAVSRVKEKNGLRVTKHGQLATRREPPKQDGSQLLVLAARGGFVKDSAMVVSIEGGSFILVSSVPDHDSSALGPLSSVRWYRCFRAKPSDEANLTPAKRAKWIEMFTLKSGRKAEREVDAVTQTMENLLLASPSQQ